MSCNSNNSLKYNLTGNWRTCTNDGSYFELFMTDSSYRFATSYGLMTEWSRYSIKGDTLIQQSKVLNITYPDSFFIAKAIINRTSNESFTLDYLTSNEKWIFHRLEEEIKQNEPHKILMGINKRADKIDCPDLRTKEEKKQDSLDSLVPFEF